MNKKIADKIIANRKKRDEQITEEQRTLRFLSEKATDFINLVRERAPKNEDGTMKDFFVEVPLDMPTESLSGKCHILRLKVYEYVEVNSRETIRKIAGQNG